MAIKKLALSGGGFRATLFHLGVIRYLCETGRLEEITHIASVSGGSILAAHLVMNWSDYKNKDPRSFGNSAQKIIDFVQRDVRGRVFRFWLFVRFFPTLFTLLFVGLLVWSFPGWWLWIGSIAAAIFLLGCAALILGFGSRTALLQKEYRRQLFKRSGNTSKSILKRLLTLEYWRELFKPNRTELRHLERKGVPTRMPFG